MKGTIIILGIALVSITCCTKELFEHPDCDKLKTGIIDNNEQAVKTEIEKLTNDLKPQINGEDIIGHSLNFQKLIDRIGSDCPSITATFECYACMESHPPQSAMRLEFENGGNSVVAIIHILTPGDDILRYAGMDLGE